MRIKNRKGDKAHWNAYMRTYAQFDGEKKKAGSDSAVSFKSPLIPLYPHTHTHTNHTGCVLVVC